MSAVLELQEKREVEKPNRPTATSGETAAIREVQPLLFADVLLEVDGAKKRRLGFAAISSALLQSVFVAILLIVPLMFTEALPSQQLLTMLVAPPPPPPPPPPAAAAPARVVQRNGSDLIDGRLRTPGRIPQTVKMIQEEEAPPVLSDGSGGVVGGVPGGIPGGQISGVLGGILGSVNSTRAGIIPKLATPTRPERVRISQGVTRGQLISKIEPKYPLLAREARVQGDVILRAIISRSGEIENLQLLSGHPMLVPSALDAVKQWRYRPFLLNGEPVEVETTITVTFALMQ